MRISSSIALALSCALLPLPLSAQSRITTPLQEFGHNIGDDYFLANYAQLVKYWTKLDRESNRLKVVRIGTSVEGRPMLMSIITSPQNHAMLGRYQEIAARLARAEGLTDAQARALARQGKAVVWIDGGLHASEVLGAQQLVQFVYEMVSRNDVETQRFLRDVILLAVPANPDGMDLVSNWYMREPVPAKRSTSGLPVLYHKYIGHDNNRDSYMASQPETQAMDSIMFRAWYPQIMYNHHQTGPAGTVMFAPPFRDPFNYNFDPLIPVGIDLVGAAIHGRLIAEGKPGSTMRTGANYSTWWNGGLRTTAYFHNIIGLLTETIGNPTPMTVAFRPERLLPSGNLPYPILPQRWRFAQSMAYELSANRAVMDVASKHREDLLYNIYRMGRNSIERGSRDNWTLTPDRVEAVKLAVARDSAAKVQATPAQYISVLHPRAARDPRGYIIPSNQADFATAVKFVNALVKNGITIHRATRPFTAGGRAYPAGSYVVKTAQAFRPHILDMFEPQDHPDDILYPGAAPTPPYDNAGWTLAYQMGVRFDRILDAFDGPFERLAGFASVPTPAVAAGPPWYAISRRSNDAFTAVNRLLARGEEVYSTPAALRAGGRVLDAGTFLVRAKPSTVPIAREIASSTGTAFEPVLGVASESGLSRLRLPRIAVYDRYGGSMESGWLRFVLEKFAFPYEVVFPPTIDAGNLNAKYDVLILMDSASVPGPPRDRNKEREPSSAPAEWRARQGSMTIAKSLPQIQSFVSSGGTLLAIGEAADVAYLLELPVASAVADNDGKPLPRSKYYVPGSILSAAVDTTSAIGWGMRPRADVFFDNNPVFRLLPEARTRGIRRVAWFDTAAPLRSGWAWGQKALEGASAVVVAPIGKGHAILYGPEIYFRSQSHGTFPFLFNGIYYSQSAPR
ncbi:MAG TPA: M14 family metallopeptidase [Gemmatimonadaceae bacterium]|nr:M14 family metallopeptidase [Gemmatimonadaceae bacterium]